jgi:hypothetical protein
MGLVAWADFFNVEFIIHLTDADAIQLQYNKFVYPLKMNSRLYIYPLTIDTFIFFRLFSSEMKTFD